MAQFQVPFTAPAARVMVVDDNRVNLVMATGLLKKFGVKPELANSGQECLDKASPDLDLIFMDQMMPEMDGLETLKRLRAMGGAYEKLPVVALTASIEAEAEQTLLSGGMDGFLAKPIEAGALCAVLEKWLPEEKKVPAEPA